MGMLPLSLPYCKVFIYFPFPTVSSLNAAASCLGPFGIWFNHLFSVIGLLNHLDIREKDVTFRMAAVFTKCPVSALVTDRQTQHIVSVKEQGVAQALGVQAGGGEKDYLGNPEVRGQERHLAVAFSLDVFVLSL